MRTKFGMNASRSDNSESLHSVHRSDRERCAKDVLGQVWRNSEILKQKFDALKVAFILMAIAIFPWVVAVAMFSAVSADTKSLLMR